MKDEESFKRLLKEVRKAQVAFSAFSQEKVDEIVRSFTDGDEKMCRYILGILHSRLCNLFLYKYCYNYSKLTMHTDAKYLKKIPLPTSRT